MAKSKAALYWCASCGGCEEAFLDLADDFLTIADSFEFILWPLVLDARVQDVEALPDREITVSFITGGIRTSDQEWMAKLLRRKSALVIACGSCAHIGGVPGLANLFSRAEIFEYLYHSAPSVTNKERKQPLESTTVDGRSLSLPHFFGTLRTIDQVIEVDYYVPGCAPPPVLISKTVERILSGDLPKQGTVLAPDTSLCNSCQRRATRPEGSRIRSFARVHEVVLDPDRCFLDQGVICLGPATRDGCGERCIEANMPCRGCFGPTSKVQDQGLRFLSALASIIDPKEEREIQDLVDSIADPVGLFYYYSLPSSMLRKKWQ